MSEPSPRPTEPEPSASSPSPSPEPEATDSSSQRVSSGTVHIIVWGILSIALLGFVTFGWMNIRYWENFYDDDGDYIGSTMVIEPERILTVWSTQVSNLPAFGSELVSQILFVGAALLFLVGVVVALWFLLLPGTRTKEAAPATPSTPEHS